MATHGCRERRVRKLPAHVVIYLLIALCLYPDDDYEEVAEKLTGMLALVPGARWQAPTRGAVTQARQRLGTGPVKEVFQQIARPSATASTPGAWLNRRRVMAIDGFVLDLPDTADVAGCWAGEQTLAFSLYRQLTAEMPLTGDRGFSSFPAWNQARHSGAHLLWRVQAGLRPYWLRDLADGYWPTGTGWPSSPNPPACAARGRTGCARPPARAETWVPSTR
ncbi:transposase domain-containing protein [Nonomuraea sp. NPDC050783]|uniref:transposase domain-containing protein n=1 Tax=Nonomuraea sp. NPDC050783 TaxID=3154634 RepID=UPI0034673050